MTLLNAEGSAKPVVAIVVPCQDQLASGFAYDLTRMVGFITAHNPEIRLLLYFNKGTIIPEQRHLLVRQALQVPEVTHLLWIDSDMRFPKDALLRLLGHAKPIVAVNYPTRRNPVIPTAGVGKEDVLLFSAPEDTELVPVDRCGMGMMLVEADVHRKIPAPWFALGFSKAQDGFAGEDVFFGGVVREHGYQILIDPVLSREMRHCGEFEFGLHHADITHARFLETQRAEAMARAEAQAPKEE